MKKYLHQVAQYTALVLIASIPIPSDVFADDLDRKHTAPLVSVAEKTSKAQRKVVQDRKQQVSDEAADVLTGTEGALVALEKNNTEKALAILQTVSGKLDSLLVENRSLAFLPADIETEIMDFDGDANAIAKAIADVDDLLDDGKTQDARKLLDGLVSEMRISTTGIPLGTFHAAIKDAVSLISTGKSKDAENVLYDVLNTLVTATEVIPLPVLNAEELLTEASELEHKTDLSKEQSRQEVLTFADAAKLKLQRAVLLGYGGKDDYKVLYSAIDEIKETIHSKSSDATWKKIKDAFAELKNKIVKSK